MTSCISRCKGQPEVALRPSDPGFAGKGSSGILPDVLQPGLNLVICGTAAGRRSAKKQAYYAHPGNRFWDILHETKLTPRRLAPQEFRQLPTYGIGLTDLAKQVSGSDADIERDSYDVAGFRRKIQRHQPRVLAFSSKTAAAVYLGKPTGGFGYGRLADQIGNTVLFALPSTSGRAAGYWDAERWHECARLTRELRG